MNSVMSMPARDTDSQILQYYMERLNEAQKRVLLSVAKAFVNEPEDSEVPYSDAFIAELDRRSSELEGSVKGYSWEEVRQRSKARR